MPLRHAARDERRAPRAQPLLFCTHHRCAPFDVRILCAVCAPGCTIGARQKKPAGCNACGSLSTVRTGTVRTRTARTSTARTGIAHRSAPLSSGPQVLSDSLRSARHRYAPLRTAPEGIAPYNFAPFRTVFLREFVKVWTIVYCSGLKSFVFFYIERHVLRACTAVFLRSPRPEGPDLNGR